MFKEFAQLGLNLTFLATNPCQEKDILAFCLPISKNHSCTEIISRIAPEIDIDKISPVTTFSMNGPHFGDRYGIASELLAAFERNKIRLLGLSCTIASITGVVPSPQLKLAIQAIKECFEIPSIIKRD
jgi:aspartokinase